MSSKGGVMESGELVCLSCGHRQERNLHAKTRPRCSVCYSRRFGGLNSRGELEKVKISHRARTGPEKVNDTIDNRRIGTVADISMPTLSRPKVKKEKEEKDKKGKEEERESWRKNELLHQQGRREQTGLIREAAQFVGSMVSEKNPRGHGSKAINHAFRIAEIKRQLSDEGGDIRLLGENVRKLTGDSDSLFGFGIVRSGKGGILEHFRRKE